MSWVCLCSRELALIDENCWTDLQGTSTAVSGVSNFVSRGISVRLHYRVKSSQVKQPLINKGDIRTFYTNTEEEKTKYSDEKKAQ